MTTEQTTIWKQRLKYGLYALVFISGLAAGHIIPPDVWLAALKVIWPFGAV